VTRAFLALLLSEEVRVAIGAEIARLRPLGRAVAWVPETNLHVTLKFLGEQPDDKLAAAAGALAPPLAECAPFAMTLHGLGGFPGMERPRILWVGIADGALAAREIETRVEAALEPLGFSREARPWHPHVTIGRVFDERRWRQEAGLALRQAVAAMARQSFGETAVTRVVLMRSDLSPRGARYSELASIEIAGMHQRAG
jgi:RNA 2',3'-cyclic 3'-phosphodiesterase